MYIIFFKRFFDVFIASSGLIVLSPLLICTAVIIKLSSKGPVFFLQTRIGKNLKPFKLYKFRSMNKDAAAKGPKFTTSTDYRITKVGHFIRKYKIDELPQLINVLKGDIAIVGPRPLVRDQINISKVDFKNILDIRPGITDFSAIEFINEEALLDKQENPDIFYKESLMPQKLKLYQKYKEDMSFMKDLKIILRTIVKVFS